MKLVSWFRGLLAFIFHRRQVEREMEAELRAHLESRADDLERQGLPRAEAERQARLEFGGYERYKEECREALGSRLLGEFVADTRYGLRQLRRSPGFTAVAVLTLALGIGATTAIFTVVNTVLLHPLPYPDSGRIVNIGCSDEFGRYSDNLPMVTFWLENNPGFEDLAAYRESATSVNLSGGDRPELVQGLKVSRNYFRLFGANPILGRTFSTAEDQPGGPNALLMSFGLWQRRFGADPSIVGKAITLGGASYTVIGVLSPHFKPYPSAEAWIPLQADPSSTDQGHILTVAGRLPRSTTLAQANSWMKVLGKRYVEAHPEQLGGDERVGAVPMRLRLTGDVRPGLLILLGAVGLVLLLACANVANLLLARSLGRQREITVRAAIGAGRARIIRQLLTESLPLALAGGVLGLTFGSWGLRALLALAPTGLPRIQEMARVPALDAWVAGFSVVLSVVTGVLFGLLPAFQLSRVDLVSSLKELSARSGAGLRQGQTRAALVATEMAIAVVLLCGAMLLMRSFLALHSVQPGFDPRNLLTMKVALAGPEEVNAAAVDRLAYQTAQRVARIPGVDKAAVASSLPTQAIVDMLFDIPGRPALEGFKFTGDVLWCAVSWSYFDTLRIPLRSGRLFREQEPPHTVIINEAMARKFWPKQNPVGQSMVIGAGLGPQLDQGSTEIVGVVGDVHHRLNVEPPPTMYQVWSNVPDGGIRLMSQLYPASIAVRTKPGVAPMSVSEAVKQALLARDTQLPASKVETMEQVMLESTGQDNFDLLLLSIFAASALLLAAVGIFGVTSYSVQQRTHEIGIRAALGAQKRDVLTLVVGQGMVAALAGVGAGLIGALALTRFLSSMLFGVKPTDPLTFFVVALILIAVALLAAYIPARRATTVDPVVALRYE
jgi:predicted permease